MYKTKIFNDGYGIENANAYCIWLERIQKEQKIDIIAITNLNSGFLVTYKIS